MGGEYVGALLILATKWEGSAMRDGDGMMITPPLPLPFMGGEYVGALLILATKWEGST